MILAILLIVTLIYPLTTYFAVQAYQSWRTALLERYPEGLEPTIGPFIYSFWGVLTLIFGLAIASSWLLLGIWRKKLKLLALLLLLMLPSTMVSVTYAGYYETTVDALATQDEEFRFEFPAGWQRYLGWEWPIYYAFDYFYDTFNIKLKLRGWINWESSNSEHDLKNLLKEAKDETGFVNGEPTHNGYVIDILLVFCGHLTLFDQSGWSYSSLVCVNYPLGTQLPENRNVNARV